MECFRTQKEETKHLTTVLSLLSISIISLKFNKFSLFQLKLHYLGLVMSRGNWSVADTAANTFKFSRSKGI